MSKLVSIVLPTYNGEKFLKQSIDSCLNQTYQNIELIIVNDCSKDSSEDIIKSYKDNRIRYYKNEQNLKLPASLNRGFSLAKGEYFTWTSDDNYYKNNAIDTLVRALEQSKSDLVYANYSTIDNDDNLTGTRIVGERRNILLDNVVKACFLYKSEMHNKLEGYRTDLFLVEDYDFWIRAAFNNFIFKPIKDELYFYRFHQGSLTESRRKEIAQRLLQLLNGHLPTFIKEGKHEFVNYKVYLKLAKLFASNNDKLRSRENLKAAFVTNPISVFRREFIRTIIKNIK
ncbi:glycosyltransferase [Pontibacter litorisediminis]|uniref:glycosyltransferase n=1 Tax=Pontibacter litorisediminis TaxID=1846260 RepID=UPI0023EB823F|nr:glycosyltransferase [Pontibacter litorisediminis]